MACARLRRVSVWMQRATACTGCVAYGQGLDVLVQDKLQLVRAPKHGGRYEDEEDEKADRADSHAQRMPFGQVGLIENPHKEAAMAARCGTLRGMVWSISARDRWP